MSKTTQVVLDSGERLDVCGEDERGVFTDAGIIPWDWVLGFRTWSEQHQKWFSIPL